jgi:arylsulfatase A-like enzyme
MKAPITRRDFLKLAGLLPLGIATHWLIDSLSTVNQDGKSQNIVIVVFDAFSAYNISLYGYQRETTPNLARLAERAVVYHNHYAGGNSTMPGTASILTGAYPWMHRAFGLDKKTVDASFNNKNIFSAFEPYYRLAYTHNPVADRILTQFHNVMDNHVPLKKLFLANEDFLSTLFGNDEDTASVSWVRAMKSKEEGYAYSLFFARLLENQREKLISNLREQYPVGIPHIDVDDYFLLEDATNWLGDTLGGLTQPFLGYFHFLPPHRPYLTHKDFQGRFAKDSFTPVIKPPDTLFTEGQPIESLLRKRRDYDEFILYVDREFGRLMDKMDQSGLLENTWVVLTSDHGEMFERGVLGHITPLLYQPVIRVPLMIFEPGQQTRTDIYANTSAVDLLPTLLHLARKEGANWSEGSVFSPYAPTEPDPERDLYVVQARRNDQYKPLTVATIVLVKGQYKLMYFFGYDELGGKERIELYDVQADPEEMNDLYSSKRETADELLNILKTKLAEVNKPYQ